MSLTNHFTFQHYWLDHTQMTLNLIYDFLFLKKWEFMEK
ncbi:hypothetical protein L911_2911 [Vibrio fluvialis I21563]|nr:hypothetical protein L911_2911 [Vibrio fluvialis I21563]